MAENGFLSSKILIACPIFLMIWLMGLVALSSEGRASLTSLTAPPERQLGRREVPGLVPGSRRGANLPATGLRTAAIFAYPTRCRADRPLRMDRPSRISVFNCHGPMHLRLGNLSLRVEMRSNGPDVLPDAIVTVRTPGEAAQRIVAPQSEQWDLYLTVGRLDRTGARYVLVQSYSGGNHCCVGVRLAIPGGSNRGSFTLGNVDVAAAYRVEEAPTDLDGDGRTDFVVRDQRFLYEFGGYGGTAIAPLRIWNVQGGRAVEVSAEPRFRAAYMQDLAGRRRDCIGHQGNDITAACPQYVATAARLGRFSVAWREMLSVYDPAHHDGTIYEHCPHHLRRFLRAAGYLGT